MWEKSQSAARSREPPHAPSAAAAASAEKPIAVRFDTASGSVKYARNGNELQLCLGNELM